MGAENIMKSPLQEQHVILTTEPSLSRPSSQNLDFAQSLSSSARTAQTPDF